MNLDVIRPNNQIEDLLLSITKNRESINEQTYRKAETIMEFKLTKRRETYSFSSPITIEWSWMICLTSLEVCNSVFNITE